MQHSDQFFSAYDRLESEEKTLSSLDSKVVFITALHAVEGLVNTQLPPCFQPVTN